MTTEPGARRRHSFDSASGEASGSPSSERASLSLDEVFRDYLDDYFDFYSDLTYPDFRRGQRGMSASLAFGAAGVAFAHWYAGARSGEKALFQAAERWIGSAIRARRGGTAFTAARIADGAGMPAGAVLYGEAGLWLVGALVDHSLGRPVAVHRSIDRWAALSSSADASFELYTGASGSLVAAAMLLDQVGDCAAVRPGHELADRLNAAVKIDRDGRASWPDLEGPWLAHGTAGPLLALLLWSRASGTRVPGWLAPAIERSLLETLAEPDRFAPRAAERSWLCRGYAGLAHLALQADQALGGAGFGTAARQALALSMAHPSAQADLCCGRLAVAAVCLEQARDDPEGVYRAHAERAIASTLLLDRDDWQVGGLYGGEAALPCLVLDALAGTSAGPPGLSLLSRDRRWRSEVEANV